MGAAATDAQLRELGPPVQLAGDDVGRPSLHNNPAGLEVSSLVMTSPQQLLVAVSVGFELGHQDLTVVSFSCRRSLASIHNNWPR